MGSVTRYRKRSCFGGTWSSWNTITGSSIIGSNYTSHCVYSINVSMSASERLDSITFKNTFASDISTSLTFQFYLYTSDPTSATSPPSGYVSYKTSTRSITTAGIASTINFTGLNLSGVTTLYVWVTGSYNASGGGIYCCDESGISQPTAVTGSFSTVSMSLSISPSSVTAGNKVTLDVTNGSGTGLTATFKYGNTTLANQYFSNGSLEYTCPASWFDTAGVTTLQSMTINVEVTGGVNALTGSFTLNASSAMKPSVGTPSTAIVQPSPASTSYPSTCIAGISKCKVSVTVTARTNAAISSVILSYPGGSNVTMTYNSSTGKYEGTTAAPLTGDTTFTITATDRRGLQTQATAGIYGVVAYTPPSVAINLAYRCNSSGVEESGGTYWRIRVTATYSTALSGNSLQKLTAEIENGTEYSLISGSTSSPLPGMTNPKSAYKVIVTVRDKVSGEITKEIMLEGISRNFVITRSGDGTYVGTGTTPTRTSGPSAYELPGNGSFLLGGKEYGAFGVLVDGATVTQYLGNGNESFNNDFLNVDLTDRYALCNAAATFSSWAGGCANGPNAMASSVFGGLRIVHILCASVAVVLLIEATPTPGRIWINVYSSEWKGWKYFYTVNDS